MTRLSQAMKKTFLSS